MRTDVVIVGGGIVGLATAWRLLERHPRTAVTIVEKEDRIGAHQSSHNSGVLHSGIYYRPGSLKARNCRDGKLAMQEFCAREGIPHEICGKVIVAVDDTEVPAMERILERGRANGVQCERIGPERLRELEPHAAGVAAIHVPETGIVDFGKVCDRLAERVQERDATVRTGERVVRVRHIGERMVLETTRGEIDARVFVNCAGLHCDRVARLSGKTPKAKIVPFRGEYYKIRPVAHRLVRNLIYPVPDPSFPFLGVHFTRRVDGELECGPNAVLAFAREGYRKFDLNPRDLCESLTYPGFLRLASRYWRTGLAEMWRSFSKAAFVRALQRLVPDIRAEHLEHAPAGVRAQAVSRDGALVDDFLIVEDGAAIHLNNAPSPAATASLHIGQVVLERIEPRLG